MVSLPVGTNYKPRRKTIHDEAIIAAYNEDYAAANTFATWIVDNDIPTASVIEGVGIVVGGTQMSTNLNSVVTQFILDGLTNKAKRDMLSRK